MAIVSRPNLRVSAFVPREQRVLMVQQGKADAEYWLLPGGAVERGETLESAIRRELREECGLAVLPLHPPLGMAESISPDQGASRHVVHVIYAAEVLAEESTAMDDPAIRRVAWLSSEELAAMQLHPPLHDVLAEWLYLFRQGRPHPWPGFKDLGVRWV